MTGLSRHLVVLAALLLATASCRNESDRLVVTEVAAAPGLAVGARVIFRGIEVGRVEQLTLEHSGVRLALRIHRDDAPLRVGDRVAVRTVGMFGEAVVDVVPGPGTASPLGDSATLAAYPPDTLAPARVEAARALGKAIIESALQQYSDSSSERRAASSRQ